MVSMRLVGRGIVALALVVAVVLGIGVLDPGATPTPASPSPGGSAGSPAAASTSAEPATAAPSDTPAPTNSGPAPSITQLVGQKLVVRMEGVTPSADLLGRIGRGEIGGVILFGANVTTKAALIALIGTLQDAAAAGGQPPLLIAVDQEGGTIKRIPWAPPTLSVPEMGVDGRATVVEEQGASTGAALHELGINVDLAPVADVPGSPASFMYKDKRTWSFDATRTAELADAFASGLQSAGVLPSMKHFPGLGLATKNTDTSVVTITATSDALDAGLEPYRTAIASGIPMIMLSNATYSAYDPDNAAGWSAAISDTLLRGDLGFTGVTITDSLAGTAKARGLSPGALAIRAARAGTDVILVSGTEAATRSVYAALVKAVTSGSISATTLQASYERILALKAGF
jgi:beta-N-acetylhexosaminidase